MTSQQENITRRKFWIAWVFGSSISVLLMPVLILTLPNLLVKISREWHIILLGASGLAFLAAGWYFLAAARSQDQHKLRSCMAKTMLGSGMMTMGILLIVLMLAEMTLAIGPNAPTP
jgi:hypothetical protein